MNAEPLARVGQPMNTTEFLLFIAIIAGGTMLTRFLPFLLFPENKKTPEYVRYLGEVLPYTIIGMLVVYCLGNTVIPRYPFALPEAISIGAIVFLQLERTLAELGPGRRALGISIESSKWIKSGFALEGSAP